MGILLDFNEDAWNAFHDGDFDDQDGFYTFFKEWIDRKCIYRRECKEVLMEIPNCDPFCDHPVWGRPNSWRDAAMNCLDDYLMEEDETWHQIEKYCKEEGIW